jgi:hypothetical protein
LGLSKEKAFETIIVSKAKTFGASKKRQPFLEVKR